MDDLADRCRDIIDHGTIEQLEEHLIEAAERIRTLEEALRDMGHRHNLERTNLKLLDRIRELEEENARLRAKVEVDPEFLVRPRQGPIREQ